MEPQYNLPSENAKELQLPPDTTPPQIALIGSATVTVRWQATYSDPGAYASDAQGTATVTTSGFNSFRRALNSTKQAALGAAIPGARTYGPWMVRYTATDTAGNTSPTITRQLYIDASCPVGEFRCVDTGACSVSTLCVQGLPPALVPQPPATAAPYTPPVDTVPPTLWLNLLPGDINSTQTRRGTPLVLQLVTTQLRAGATFVDPGANAIDNVDGNLTAAVSRLGLRSLDTSLPTTGDPQLIEYRVADAAGNIAVALRAVRVVCAPSERVCARAGGGAAFCSDGGVCLNVAKAQTNRRTAVVTLQLIGDKIIFLRKGEAYSKCQAERPLDLLCDQVCLAMDAEDVKAMYCALPHLHALPWIQMHAQLMLWPSCTIIPAVTYLPLDSGLETMVTQHCMTHLQQCRASLQWTVLKATGLLKSILAKRATVLQPMACRAATSTPTKWGITPSPTHSQMKRLAPHTTCPGRSLCCQTARTQKWRATLFSAL